MIHLTHEQIAKRAYEIYLRSGSLPGRDEENWIAAETELRREIETAQADAKPKPNGHSSVHSPVKAKPATASPIAPAVTVTTHMSAPSCGCSAAPASKAKTPKARKAKARF